MASVVWMAVFILLMIELFITGLLVLPLPRLIRRFIAKKIFTYDLAKRVRFLSNFIILGLVLAVSDAITTLRRLEQKLDMSSEGVKPNMGESRTGYIEISMDKQRKFRAERNVRLRAPFDLIRSTCGNKSSLSNNVLSSFTRNSAVGESARIISLTCHTE